MTTNPAALKAIAEGDLDNYRVASTPGGIEAQEKAGQTELVASTNMPKDMSPSREAFEELGFIFGDDVDDIFISAQLPKGWTRQATSHSMHSYVLDEQGHRRISVFYKAVFYDRHADAYVVPRFRVECKYPDNGGDAIDESTIIPVIVTDNGVEIHRAGESKYMGDWERRRQLENDTRAWLNANRAGWDDPVKGWGI